MNLTPRTSSNQLPLLVQFTPLVKVNNVQEPTFVYDDQSQTVVYNPMTCAGGTTAMKTWITKTKVGSKVDSGIKKVD